MTLIGIILGISSTLGIGQKPPDGTKVPMTNIQPKAAVGCGEFTNRTNRERCASRCSAHPTTLHEE